MQDDLEIFESYSQKLRVLESAKIVANDTDILGDIEIRICEITLDQADLALEMFHSGNI